VDTGSLRPPVHRRDAAALLHLQRAVGNASVMQLLEEDQVLDDEQAGDAASPVKAVVDSGGGQRLDAPTRSFMESRLGHDFGGVRVHTDAQAGASAASVGANAYTVGRDVVSGNDQWSPGTDAGRRMLAHELTTSCSRRPAPSTARRRPAGFA